MNLSEFKKIFTEYGGSLSPDQIEALAEFCPNLPIGVKVGYGSRFTTTASNFKLDLENNVKFHLDVYNVDQYIREVFVPITAYDEVRRTFGWY